MNRKEELLSTVIHERLGTCKVGLLMRGIDGISPLSVLKAMEKPKRERFHATAVGYADGTSDEKGFLLTAQIEDAVKWRSDPSLAGHILVFVKQDADKLHSLKELDVVTPRTLSEQLIREQYIGKMDISVPIKDFWFALEKLAAGFALDALLAFADSVKANVSTEIQNNLWRLGLLCDSRILTAGIKPEERLEQNRDLIIAIGQVSAEQSKRLAAALKKCKPEDQARYQVARRNLHDFFKFGKIEPLKALDFDTVRELLLATKQTSAKRGDGGKPKADNKAEKPIKEKELGSLISDCVVFPTKENREALSDLRGKLQKGFVDSDNVTGITVEGGAFGGRKIMPDAFESPLSQLVYRFCTVENWGGVMETDETTLRDAVAASPVGEEPFKPKEALNKTACDNLALFACLCEFDKQFAQRKVADAVEPFAPILERLNAHRGTLLANLDMLMRFPVLEFGTQAKCRDALFGYVEAWTDLLRAYCKNEVEMHKISPQLASASARSLLLLDVLYIKTPTEWKGLLLPLHPIWLWRFSEIFTSLQKHADDYTKEDKQKLGKVFSALPQILNFLIADRAITGDSTHIELPCSGRMLMLPTFENKTNRYLGVDGVECVEEILSRWLAFAPYTARELRICAVDVPDHAAILRMLAEFAEERKIGRIVCRFFLTRGQNATTELAGVDFASKDFKTGDMLRSGRICLSLKSASNLADIKTNLKASPVHVGFFFDQSSYSIGHGPCERQLYVNPLVVTYDYQYDPMTRRGEIFPSSDMETGIIGDYHKMLRLADLTTNNRIPRPVYNPAADVQDLSGAVADREVVWLAVVDRSIANYRPANALPIGEKRYGQRMLGVWCARDSRIINQYLRLLRNYNIQPNKEALLGILAEFGHIASDGLVSIPRTGGDVSAADSRRKGLIGGIFAAKWFAEENPNSLVASLDSEDARLWLHNRGETSQDATPTSERADLIGLRYDEEIQTLHVIPIEVKTRDDSPDFVTQSEGRGVTTLHGHAADQIKTTVGMIREIFSSVSVSLFNSARREVLKVQLVSECFRELHDHDWQKKWEGVFKRLFRPERDVTLTIKVHGLLIHVRLNEGKVGKTVTCVHRDDHDCEITLTELTAGEIQRRFFGGGVVTETPWENPDFDETKEVAKEEWNHGVHGLTRIEEVAQRHGCAEKSKDDLNNETFKKNPCEFTIPSESETEINRLISDFKRSCAGFHIQVSECPSRGYSVGPGVIRVPFTLRRGQLIAALQTRLEDIGREMQRTGILIQSVPNSNELYLDIPRLRRDHVLFDETLLPTISSPEQLPFLLGWTPDGRDLIKDLSECPHLLVGGSTGSGKTVFLWTLLRSLIKTHPTKDDMQILLSSSGLEDFIQFEQLPHLFDGKIFSDAAETAQTVQEVVWQEFERRKELLIKARVENIKRYNETQKTKLAPLVVIIDEFADLTDQFGSKKEKEAFFTPLRQIAQIGRKRGIHLVLCTQRPAADLVPSNVKAQLNARLALRVNDYQSSKMILDDTGAQYLQKRGDMLFKNGADIERVQGCFIVANELSNVLGGNDVKVN